MKNKWKLKEKNKQRITEIQEKFGVRRLTASILAEKNIKDEEIKIFLEPTRKDFYDPFELPDMKKAIDRIIKAMDNNEKILVYGDYDADGITSTTIIKRFMKDRKIDVGTYIPNRLDEGYGLNEEAIKSIADQGYNLIITVDCGITSINEVEQAKKLGVDVIITDHHEPLDEIPKAIAVVDAKRKDNKYPFNQLAGCGVAFKLMQALAKRLEINENEILKYIDIACVGTISDIVPLIDENRTIAKLGLMLLKQTQNAGLKELINIIKYKAITSQMVSFGISPRINACGRMGHQEDALELFLTDDPIEARKLATKVEEYNQMRQAIEKRIYEECLEMIPEDYDGSAIVLGKENWHHGVIGIVSSKITEKYYKPSVLVCFEGENARGSGRSVKDFDLHEAIVKCSNHLQTFGGHSMAIGLGLKTCDFDTFKKEFEEYVEKNIKKDELTLEIEIDDEITSRDLDIETIREITLLEPFGESNTEPVLLFKNLKITGIRSLSDGKHLKLTLQSENIVFDAIGFGMGEIAEKYLIGDKVDIIGNLQINTYNGVSKPQFLLKDIRRSL